MRGFSPNRKRASGPVVTLWVTVASLAIHGLVIAAVAANGYLRDAIGMTPAVRSAVEPRPEAKPRSSCEADEALATAAQALYCATPLAALDRAECLRKALDELQAGHARCQETDLPPTSVALLDPKVLDQIEPEPLEALLAPEPLEPPEEPPPQEEAQALPAPPPPTQNTQVVEVTRPETEEAPENTRFLSEYDTRVDKETVARGSTEEMVARPEQRELQPVERPREASVQESPEEPAQAVSEQPDAPEADGRLAMRAPGSPEPSRLPRQETTPGVAEGSEATPSENGAQIRKGTGEIREAAREAGAEGPRGEGGGGGGRPRVPNLQPTAEVLERALGGGSVDLTEGVEEGEITALNAKQWKHASFFNRMKRQVAQSWNPGAVLVRRDPNGKVYGSKDRVTLVRVTLDTSGALIDVVVLKGSGVAALDEEATRAFRAAQPFPNPPAGMISDAASQQISFTFGFHVQMGARGWRIFRSR